MADANGVKKGTGRAHQVLSSPQWRGGGAIGPTPRSYAYKLPQKFVALRLNLFTQKKVAENKFEPLILLNLQLQNC